MKILALFTALVLSFLLFPLLWVAQKGLSAEAFQRLASREDILEAATTSVLLGLVTATVATLFGTMIAFGLRHFRPSVSRDIQKTLTFPMVLPEIALALAYLVWFLEIGGGLGWSTLIIGHCGFSLGYATLIMKTRVDVFDTRIMDAARDLGAGAWGQLRHAVLPQLFPALMSSFLTCFSLSLDDFFISFFLKGLDQKLLPLQVFSMMRLKLAPEIFALSLVMICISLAGVVLSQLWQTNKTRPSR